MKKIKLLCLSLVLVAISCDKEQQVNEPILDDSSEIVDFEALGFEKIKDETVADKIRETSKGQIVGIYVVNFRASINATTNPTAKFLTIDESGSPAFKASEAGPKERWYLVHFSNGNFQIYGSNIKRLVYYPHHGGVGMDNTNTSPYNTWNLFNRYPKGGGPSGFKYWFKATDNFGGGILEFSSPNSLTRKAKEVTYNSLLDIDVF